MSLKAPTLLGVATLALVSLHALLAQSTGDARSKAQNAAGSSAPSNTASNPSSTPNPTPSPTPDSGEDTDADGVPDAEDGWPKCPNLAPAILPIPHYVIIEIGEADTSGTEINNAGHALVTKNGAGGWFWNGSIGVPVGNNPRSLNENDYYIANDQSESGTDEFWRDSDGNSGSYACQFSSLYKNADKLPTDLNYWAKMKGSRIQMGNQVNYPFLSGLDQLASLSVSYSASYKYISSTGDVYGGVSGHDVYYNSASAYGTECRFDQGWTWSTDSSKGIGDAIKQMIAGGYFAWGAIGSGKYNTQDYPPWSGLYLSTTTKDGLANPLGEATPVISTLECNNIHKINILSGNKNNVCIAGERTMNARWALYRNLDEPIDEFPEDIFELFLEGGTEKESLGTYSNEAFHSLEVEHDLSQVMPHDLWGRIVWQNYVGGSVSSPSSFEGARITNQNTIIWGKTIWLDSKAGLKNDQPTDSTPTYTKIEWQDDWGPCPPSALNAKMRGFNATSIWQNGQWISLTDNSTQDLLVPAITGPTPTWKALTIRDQNDNGVLVGSAVKISDNKSHAVLLVPADIVPDYNRDGVIDNKDRGKVTEQKPWRWWTNDDDDNGDLSNEDAPLGIGSGNADAGLGSNHIDGTCDLIDWFPLFLDLKQLLEVLPPGQCQYYLKQENAALNFVYTDLTPGEAGNYLRDGATADALKNAQSYIVLANGSAQLTTEFLNKIKNDGKGVILLEGGSISDKPLYVQVFKDGNKLAEIPFHLKIDGVEKMYRWINLRSVAGQTESRGTDTSEPANYPDKQTNGKMFVFVHGYNVNEHQSRGWCAEAFKRLYQTGSKAMFTGVSWHGDSSQIPGWVPFAGGNSPDYWENVTHAFQSSQALAPLVNNLPGSSKTIAAHSLGNMVVSSAIKDHGMTVAHYFLFDAAVAIEAYDQSTLNIAEMREPTWQNYGQRLWASDWHLLFASNDGRSKLAWGNRFGSIAGAYNFFSSGEDVLNNATGTVPGIGAERSWALQEMVKGTGHIGALATLDNNGGWGFNTDWNITEMIADPNHPEVVEPYSRKRTPEEAAQLTDEQLQSQPFFKLFQDGRLVTANQGSAAANEYLTRAKVLGDAIPALSFAAGRNPVLGFEDRNVDLMTKKDGWPHTDGRWHHGDAKDVAYRFNHPLWESWVTLGGLK